jgi:hypothetical protein
MNALLIILLLASVLGAWVYVECRADRVTRIVAGCVGLLIVAVGAYNVGQVIPHYERYFHRSAIRSAGEALARGEVQRVQKAFESYLREERASSSYSAVQKLSSELHGKVPIPGSNTNGPGNLERREPHE